MRWKKREEGQAMVEFSLILPVLLLLLCGILDFGWILSNELIASNTSREAARYAAVHSDAAGITAAESIIDNTPNLTITGGSGVTVSGDNVTATVEGTIPVLTPFLSAIIGQTYTVEAETTMRVEN